ncbi:MAG: ribosome biogenesis GTPase YlqF [Candidatus Xenobium sp.]|jgi:ribosome biogenesis GTPase A|nr:ribosome biogenesis GTPase YlqF [Burkholderiales bacterium]
MKEPGPPKAPRAFSWFPGHMRKALRRLEESLTLADIVLMVLDSRIPASSRQPELEEMLRRKGKDSLLVLNKSDLAEKSETERWLACMRREGHQVAAMQAVTGRGAGPLEKPLEKLRQAVHARRKKRGLLPRDPRLVVVGIPNVGKSSLLNRLAGATRARTGARPGVTRGNQWVAVPGKWQILDSPGILYPRIEGEEILTSLAAVSCVSLDAIPLERVGALLLQRLIRGNHPPQSLYVEDPEAEPEALLRALARRKNFLVNAQEDLPRTARWLLQSFAKGDLGAVTLETAP